VGGDPGDEQRQVPSSRLDRRATSVFCGRDGTMMPSVVARSCFHSHSKSLYLRVTHPLTFVYPGRVLQYVTLYSTRLLIPSPARCGSDTSI
jgi:hypothetical protein